MQFCFNVWAHIEDNKNRGIYFNSRGHFELPDCDKLPKYKIENKSATCSYAGLIEMKPEEITCKSFCHYRKYNLLLYFINSKYILLTHLLF